MRSNLSIYLRPLALASLTMACGRRPVAIAPAIVDVRAAGKLAPVAKPAPSATPPLQFAVGDPVPEGCFAWSARKSAFACTLGNYSVEAGALAVTVHFIKFDKIRDTPQTLEVPESRSLDAAVVDRLNDELRNGGYVERPPLELVVGDARSYDDSIRRPKVGTFGLWSLSLASRETWKSCDGLPALNDVTLRVALSGVAVIDDVVENIAGSCEAGVWSPDAGHQLLLERHCFSAEGQYGRATIEAWLCDASIKKCDKY
jgi:hypothetical protein